MDFQVNLIGRRNLSGEIYRQIRNAIGDGRLLRPFKIVLEDGRGQGSVQVTFHEMTPNQPLNAADLGQV